LVHEEKGKGGNKSGIKETLGEVDIWDCGKVEKGEEVRICEGLMDRGVLCPATTPLLI